MTSIRGQYRDASHRKGIEGGLCVFLQAYILRKFIRLRRKVGQVNTSLHEWLFVQQTMSIQEFIRGETVPPWWYQVVCCDHCKI